MPRDYKANPPKILVVEDDEDLCRCLTQCFERAGYSVATARDGRKALESALRGEFDIITTDLALPKYDGLQFIQQLRSSSRKHTNVVVISGNVSHERVRRLAHLKISKIYMKPFSTDELLSSVNKLIQYDSTRRLLPAAADNGDEEEIRVGVVPAA